MQISILTLFPSLFEGPFNYSMLKRAQEKGCVQVNFVNIRDYAIDKYGTVDGKPYGGGVGMLMRVDVLDRALTATKALFPKLTKKYTILTDPKGETYNQQKAQELVSVEHLIIVCGHYEGIDARVTELVDSSISIGSYVLTGGELPAMVIADSVIRLVPGVLSPGSTTQESFSAGTLEHPQYTRPATYNGMNVPEELISGNHQKITDWKKKKERLIK